MLRTELVRTIPELLAAQAAARPRALAFRDADRTVTYAELNDTTARLAGHLAALGLEPGERALIWMTNRVEVAESYLAVPRAGAVAVCANPGGAEPETLHILTDSAARVVITDAEHRDAARRLAEQAGCVRALVVVGRPGPDDTAYADLLATEAPAPARDDLGLDEVAWMLYTSGTTGRPKGVLLTQRGCLWVAAASFAPIMDLRPDDVLLCPLPLFHSYALVLCVLSVVGVGAQERILPRFSVDGVRDALRDDGITVLPGVPTMFHYLVDRIGTEKLDAPALRLCLSAGAILPGALNQRWEEATGVPLLDGYGITETSTMVVMNWPTGARPRGSCGLPIPGYTVRLVDASSGRDVGQGAEGELWVRGPGVSPGYHQLPEATAAAFADGWYRTGDLARADEHGYLRITGRSKELIIRGGENIYPAEVEAAVLTAESVLDAAVVAAPHESLGEVPVAFVVPRGRLDRDAVLAACRDRLAAFKVPAELIEIDAIPRTGSGKILRYRLQQRLGER